MIFHSFNSFKRARAQLQEDLVLMGKVVRTERWQGIEANLNTVELQNVLIDVPLSDAGLDHWQADIKPNLPWADDHFLERVGGEPLNPGVQWANWPWGKSAARFKAPGRFNHTYMERLWPRYARRTEDGKLPRHHMGSKLTTRRYPMTDPRSIHGIGGYYGDLDDLVDLLLKEPHTRQAWIPLFFPEDTGVGDGGRKPCTLGYQFIVRDGRMSVYYPLRSCDFIRHWADDCYLAVRLLLWVLEKCRAADRSDFWDLIVPGDYVMHMTSLHVFEGDIEGLRK